MTLFIISFGYVETPLQGAGLETIGFLVKILAQIEVPKLPGQQRLLLETLLGFNGLLLLMCKEVKDGLAAGVFGFQHEFDNSVEGATIRLIVKTSESFLKDFLQYRFG